MLPRPILHCLQQRALAPCFLVSAPPDNWTACSLSPFLLQDYFRDVTQDDVEALLATHLNPLGDAIFRVPPCARPPQAQPQQPQQQAAVPQQAQQQGVQTGRRAAAVAAAAQMAAERGDADAVDSKAYLDAAGLAAEREVCVLRELTA